MDRRGGESLPALLQHETADVALIVLGPDHEYVGDGAVGDPSLAAGEAIAPLDFAGAGHHGSGVGAMIGFGKAETADPLAAGKLGQVLLLGCLIAERIDRHHHQRRLHAHHRAVTGVDALDFPGDQAVADIVESASAVLLGDGGAEQASLTHLAEDRRVGLLVAEGLQHAGRKLVGGELGGTLLHHALFVAELPVEKQRVLPMESGVLRHDGISSTCR